MKLADAIRKGCEQHPQSFGRLFEFQGYQVVGSCALGAALFGFYGDGANALNTSTLEREFPILTSRFSFPSSVHKDFSPPLSDVIINLNDHEKWTREQIADWIEKLEDSNEAV